MKIKILLTILISVIFFSLTYGQKKSKVERHNTPEIVDMKVLDNYFPVRSFCISLPEKNQSEDFINFVKNDLIPSGFNNLIIRVNWNFAFQTHPELASTGAWSMEQIKELVKVCKESGVTLLPLVNLLGHQSWHGKASALLRVYPQFDEKPHVKLPTDEYKWPNPDRLYCKSYCPNHPDVHKIVFECIDEVIEAFEAKNFHAGMDEVFDIADPNCPRCTGLDPAAVFANEINKINSHLANNGVRLWIWGDRLLDGRKDASGYGEWSGSITNTHRAIDMIDKSVMICDWHYRDAEQSPVLFAIKGYSVLTCGWERTDITQMQLEDLVRFRAHSSRYMSPRFEGFMQTVWCSYSQFIDEYRNGTDKALSAAKNYIYLKDAFVDYANKFANASVQQKDGKSVFGQ